MLRVVRLLATLARKHHADGVFWSFRQRRVLVVAVYTVERQPSLVSAIEHSAILLPAGCSVRWLHLRDSPLTCCAPRPPPSRPPRVRVLRCRGCNAFPMTVRDERADNGFEVQRQLLDNHRRDSVGQLLFVVHGIFVDEST
jgi:hypothetical protein